MEKGSAGAGEGVSVLGARLLSLSLPSAAQMRRHGPSPALAAPWWWSRSPPPRRRPGFGR